MLFATSPTLGQRDEVVLRTAIDERHNTFAAQNDRRVVVGHEQLIAAVEITP